jgi:hypothetical protein
MDKQLIATLAQARENHDQAYSDLKVMEDIFHLSPEWLSATSNLEQAAANLSKADADFRQEALATYGIDHLNKADAYEIKITKSITIPDENAAIAWCRTNFTPALALNKKVFETAVKAGSIPVDMGFALDVPKVFIKSDLREYIVKET